MTFHKKAVLDANIAIRAVFGVRVRHMLSTYSDMVSFHIPDICVEEARKSVPAIAERRNTDPAIAGALLEEVLRDLIVVDRNLYEAYETSSRKRIAARDPNDWPILATALLLDCPIWTEDKDFFGSGVATWTTANVELYLCDA